MTQIQFFAFAGESDPQVTLSPWTGASGTPLASYAVTEISAGIYLTENILGLSGNWVLQCKNQQNQLIYTGYAYLQGSAVVAATDDPRQCGDTSVPSNNGSLNSLLSVAEANIDYDLTDSISKATAYITALRSIVMRRPQSVTIGGNAVAFETLRQMLEQAEGWYRSKKPMAGAQGIAYYYDLSNARR